MLPTNEQRNLLDLATVKFMSQVDDALPYLRSRGLTEEIIGIAGLGVVTEEIPEFAHLCGRLWIPYMTDSGVINANARCIKPHECKKVPASATGREHKKYLRPGGMKDNLYGARTYIEAVDYICITEGEIDALTLHQIRIPALAVSGATKWATHWTSVLDDFARVVIVSDGDKAGREFSERVRNAIPWALDVPMPQDEDVNSMFLKEGAGYLKARIRA